jgi:hypothetical protein
MKTKTISVRIDVYVDDGRVFYYTLRSIARYRESLFAKAREHASKIVTGGYRHNDGNTFEHLPPHRIDKVKLTPPPSTSYPDKVRGT